MASIKKNCGLWAIIFIVALLVIDQAIKILVKTNMPLYDTIEITSWFKIHYIENNGMAFGMTFINKLVLSLFRVLAISLLCYYIVYIVRQRYRVGYLVCVALVAAGAIGNILDSMFYGLLFTEASPHGICRLVALGDGYAPFLMGRVVDMFYFPLIESRFPDWLPIWGGQDFVFFSPVFNFADACVSVGVVVMLLFYQKELAMLLKEKNVAEADAENAQEE